MEDRLVEIFIELDKDTGALINWATSSYCDDCFAMRLPANHPMLHYGENPKNYRLVDGTIIKDDKLVLATEKELCKSRLEDTCYELNASGFEYPVSDAELVYLSYNVTTSKQLEDTKYMFDYSTIETVDWDFLTVDGEQVTRRLTKLEFATLFIYANIVKLKRKEKLDSKLLPLIDAQETVEEVRSIKWDSIPDEKIPLPDIKLEDSNDTDEPELDKLKQENKELKQRVEFNELALMDAINMFSEMNK